MSSEFATWAKDFVLFNHITTRIQGEKYGNLLPEKGGRGFPYLVFLDAEGNVLVRHQGQRDVSGFAQSAGKAKAAADLRAKAAAGDKGARIEVLLADLEIAPQPPADVDAKVQALGELTADEQARLASARTANEIRHALATNDRAAQAAVGAKCAGLAKAGQVPVQPDVAQGFWLVIMVDAEERKDAAAFEQALAEMKKLLGGNPRYAQFLKGLESRLEQVKAGGGR